MCISCMYLKMHVCIACICMYTYRYIQIHTYTHDIYRYTYTCNTSRMYTKYMRCIEIHSHILLYMYVCACMYVLLEINEKKQEYILNFFFLFLILLLLSLYKFTCWFEKVSNDNKKFTNCSLNFELIAQNEPMLKITSFSKSLLCFNFFCIVWFMKLQKESTFLNLMYHVFKVFFIQMPYLIFVDLY